MHFNNEDMSYMLISPSEYLSSLKCQGTGELEPKLPNLVMVLESEHALSVCL